MYHGRMDKRGGCKLRVMRLGWCPSLTVVAAPSFCGGDENDCEFVAVAAWGGKMTEIVSWST